MNIININLLLKLYTLEWAQGSHKMAPSYMDQFYNQSPDGVSRQIDAVQEANRLPTR